MLLLEQFKQRLEELNLTNGQIAELSGLSLSTVNSVFSGASKNPSLLTAGAICAVLGISLDGIFGIENAEMAEQEISRVREEHERYKSEVNERIEEHARNIALNEVTIANDKEIIRLQEDQIKSQKDRIKSQVTVINIFRIWIFALHIYGFAMDSMVPDAGLIRGINWGSFRFNGLTLLVIFAAVLAVYFVIRWVAKRKWVK